MDQVIPKGYILVARQLLDSGIMKKPAEYLKTWVFLLSKANFKDANNLKRGQGFTSIQEIIDVLTYHVGYRKEVPTKKKVWGIIEWLRNPYEGDNEGTTKVPMIETTKVTHGFVYTVCKYDLYQTPENYEGNSEGNDEGTAKELRRERQGNNKYKNGSNNVKNGRTRKNDISIADELPLSFSMLSPSVIEAVQRFIENRKAMRKPMTANAIDLFISKLNRIAKTDEEKIDAIDRSIVAGYTDIYEPKNGYGNTNRGQPTKAGRWDKYGAE